MINYIKSELYRVSKMKGLYVIGIVCAILLIAMNVLLFVLKCSYPEFGYATTGYAFAVVESSMVVVFIMTQCVGSVLFADEHKNKTIMNSIANGYSRVTLYLGKLIMTLLSSFVLFTAVVLIFIGSAYLLLENSGTEILLHMLHYFVFLIPILVLGDVATITLEFLFKSNISATWIWFGIFVGVPAVVGILGLRFPSMAELSEWLAYNIVSSQLEIGTGELAFAAGTPGRALLIGVMGTVIFLLIGILGIRRKETI